MNKYLLLCILVPFSALTCKADFPTGVWSNKKEGFYIVNFGLRKDGKGFYSASTAQATTVARWNQKEETVFITIAAPPENPTFAFKASKDSKSGILEIKGQEPQKFYLISEEEPKDLEALARERASVEQEKAKALFTKDEKSIPSIDSLRKAIISFAASTTPFSSCSFSSDGWPTTIQLTKTNDQCSVMVNLDESRAKEKTPGVVSNYTKEEPITDLPKKVYVSGLLEVTHSKHRTRRCS